MGGSKQARISGCGGIGRRDGFRCHWVTVQVRALSSAVQEVLAMSTSFFGDQIRTFYDNRLGIRKLFAIMIAIRSKIGKQGG